MSTHTNYAQYASISTDLDEHTEYRVKLVEARALKTRNGKDMYVMKFVVRDNTPCDGLVFETEQVFSPESINARRFFFNRMHMLGAPKEFFETNPTPEQVCKQVVSDRVYIVRLRERDYNGRTKTDITQIKRA